MAQCEKQHIAMIGTGRTGSSLIWTLMERVDHLELTQPKEFLNNRAELSLKELIKNRPYGSVVMTHVKIAEYLYQDSRIDINGRSMTLIETISWLKELGFTRFIHLYRANLLRWLLSRLRSSEPGYGGKILFLHKNQKRNASKAPLRVDCEYMLLHMKQCREITDSLRGILAIEDSLDIIYECDLMDDSMVGYRKILQFGKLSSDHLPQTSLMRTNPYKVRDVVENFGELEDAFRHTRWEWMLDY